MSGNTFGHLFRVTTFGESHGVALGCVIDGCPPQVPLSVADIQAALNRRRPGQNAYTTARNEPDQVEILSGVFEGMTTGTPIGLMIRNQDQRSQDYSAIKDVFRPGHADFSYQKKYGIRDYRGGGRASARETTMRVAAGAVALKCLEQSFNVNICAGVDQIGAVQAQVPDFGAVAQNAFNFLDAAQIPALETLFAELSQAGDSVGAGIALRVEGVPPGLGAPVFDKLDADLAHALMSINAVKAVALGDGFAAISSYGSAQRDAMTESGFASNHAGGILGGISTGQPIEARVAFKATSSIKKPIQTQTMHGEPTELEVFGRHDPCVAIRAVPIVEAMAALVVLDHLLRQRAQNPAWLQE
jgi:chorismate synthase